MPYDITHPTSSDRPHEEFRECVRGRACAAPRINTTGPRPLVLPALTPRAFCDSDRDVIAHALNATPKLYVRVHMELGSVGASANGPVVTVSKDPPVPLSLQADELLRTIVETLVTWEERVRAAAGLTQLDTATSRARRDGPSLHQAVHLLHTYLDVLLALPYEPMVRDGVLEEASGAEAGLDILHLVWRCHALLTDIRQAARRLDGVACGNCDYAELHEVLDGDGQFAGAKCRRCGSEYDATAYHDLTTAQSDQVRKDRNRGGPRLRAAAPDDPSTRRA